MMRKCKGSAFEREISGVYESVQSTWAWTRLYDATSKAVEELRPVFGSKSDQNFGSAATIRKVFDSEASGRSGNGEGV